MSVLQLPNFGVCRGGVVPEQIAGAIVVEVGNPRRQPTGRMRADVDAGEPVALGRGRRKGDGDRCRNVVSFIALGDRRGIVSYDAEIIRVARREPRGEISAYSPGCRRAGRKEAKKLEIEQRIRGS